MLETEKLPKEKKPPKYIDAEYKGRRVIEFDPETKPTLAEILQIAQEDGISPEIAMMMLESNCSSESKYLPFLGVSEKDGHALLMLHIPLSVLRNEVSLYLVLDKQLFPVIEAWRNFFAEAGKNINDVKKNPLNPGFV